MTRWHSQKGFTAIETAIIVVVVLVVAGAAIFVFTRQQNEEIIENTAREQRVSDPAQANDVVEAPDIQSAEDLDAAEAALEANDPELSNNDLEQLERELDEL